jgi:hypothetical protein
MEMSDTPETYYAGAYWGARKESAGECARRAADFLASLARCAPAFSRWFKPARSRGKSLAQPLDPEPAALEKLLLKGRNRTDAGQEVIEQLGFSLGLWNGGPPRGDASLSLFCGGFSERTVNSCLLHPPQSGPGSERILTAPLLAEVVRCMVLAWEPDWGIATSSTHMDRVTRTAQPGTFIGWVTYFSRRRGAVPPLPPPVRVEPVGERGTLVILTPERFTVSNAAHLELADHTLRLLEHARLLGPLQEDPR